MEPEKLRKKLNDCKATGKLNLSYMDLPELAPSVIQQIKVRVMPVCVVCRATAPEPCTPHAMRRAANPFGGGVLRGSSIA